jgi:hypothetical protein
VSGQTVREILLGGHTNGALTKVLGDRGLRSKGIRVVGSWGYCHEAGNSDTRYDSTDSQRVDMPRGVDIPGAWSVTMQLNLQGRRRMCWGASQDFVHYLHVRPRGPRTKQRNYSQPRFCENTISPLVTQARSGYMFFISFPLSSRTINRIQGGGVMGRRSYVR